MLATASPLPLRERDRVRGRSIYPDNYLVETVKFAA
jgi:hypothetical protein